MLFKKIDLIDIENIKFETWETAISVVENIDEFDTPFIALGIELNAAIWTGDKKLIKGLQKKNIDWILDTETVL